MATAETKLHVTEFTNEPFVDFSKPDNRKKMEDALKKVKAEFGHEYPIWIAGKKVITASKKKSTNPSRPSEVIGVFQDASKEQAVEAIEAAHHYFDTWRKVPAEQRARYSLRRLPAVQERKFELAALVCYEVGKSWIEADADIAETIDFCEFYGREMLRLGRAAETHAHAWRTQLHDVHSPRRRRDHSALEFPVRHHGRLVARVAGHGQHRGAQARADSPTIAAKFVDILFEAGRSQGSCAVRDWFGRRDWGHHRAASQDALYRVHRLEGSGLAHFGVGRQSFAGPDLDQAHGARNGRQGRHDRGRRGRRRRRR